MMGDLKAYWDAGLEFGEFVEAAQSNQQLWQALFDRARVPAEVLERVAALSDVKRLLVIAEDWCGDAVNTVPLLAKLAELDGRLELRIVERDGNPELMDRYLTSGSRSIPLVIGLDGDYQPLGRWGPRPGPLQEWVLETGLGLPKEDRYREVRTWYARDRGATTLHELVSMLEATDEVPSTA